MERNEILNTLISPVKPSMRYVSRRFFPKSTATGSLQAKAKCSYPTTKAQYK